MGKKEDASIGMVVWFTCSLNLTVCSGLELDYFCQCIAWHKPRFGLVNDCEYESWFGWQGKKRTCLRIQRIRRLSFCWSCWICHRIYCSNLWIETLSILSWHHICSTWFLYFLACS